MTFEELFCGAKFVGPDTECPSVLIRREFSLSAPGKARLIICGLGHMLGEINGRPISEDLFAPAVSDYDDNPERHCQKAFGEVTAHRIYALSYDVTDLLREGPNAIGVRLYPGWYANERHGRGSSTVCLAYRLTVESPSGTQEILSGGGEAWRRSEYTDGNFFRFEEQDGHFLADGFSLPGYSGEGWRPVKALPAPDSPFFIQDCPADRVIRRIVPRELPCGIPGLRLYDAGENITGWPVLRDEGGGDRTITLTLAERLTDGALDPDYVHKQVCLYHTDGQPREYHSRSLWHAFRYFTVEGAVCDRVEVVHANVPVTASFTCSDPVISWYYDAFVRTQLCNLHGGIPSDCPQLERRGYTGDGELVCEAAMTVLDGREFYRKWIDDISDCQDRVSGHVQYTAPYTHSGGGPGGWGCAIAEVPYRFWKTYGDDGPARRIYPQVLRYFSYLFAHSEGGLVTSDQPGEWALGDWCTPGEVLIPPPFVNTWYYLRTVERMREMALAFGHEADVPGLDIRADALRRALTKAYFDPATGDFCGGVQGANLFAVALGLGDERTLARAVAHYTEHPVPDFGICGTDVVISTLFERGYADLACTLLGSEEAPSFGHWKALGATTLWEEWKDRPRSLSHPMFGSAVRCLFSQVLGIRQTPESAGFARVVISPALCRRLPSASGRIVTPHGAVEVSRVLTGESWQVCVTVDAGVDAVLSLAGKEQRLIPGRNEFTFPA